MPDLTIIPGIPEIRTRTLGDPLIKIAILDGPADLERACFDGANFTQFRPYWTQDIELNKDGTKVPMFISHKKGIQLDGNWQSPVLSALGVAA